MLKLADFFVRLIIFHLQMIKNTFIRIPLKKKKKVLLIWMKIKVILFLHHRMQLKAKTSKYQVSAVQTHLEHNVCHLIMRPKGKCA